MIYPHNIDLLSEFGKKVAEKGKIFEAIVEITHRCNLRCIHCYIPPKNHPPEASLKKWENAINLLVNNGLSLITFTGGEPLLYNGLISLISHAFKKGCQVRLFTNSTLFDSREMIFEFKRAGLCYLETSIYGATAGTHDTITRVKGSFGKTIQAIQWALEAGIPVTVKTSWMKLNWREFSLIKTMVNELGVYFRGSPDIMPRIGGNNHNLHLQLSFEELVEFYRIADGNHQRIETAEHESPKVSTPPCGIARLSVALGPSGTMFPCINLRLPIGNIFQDNLSEIWAKSPLLKQLRALTTNDFNDCLDCKYRPYCFVCIAEAWMETGNFTKPSKMTCVRAHARYIAEKTLNGKKSLISS